MLLIGIDQSDDHHDIACLVEDTGELKKLKIDNDEQGFLSLDRLIASLGFASRPQEVMVALETPKGLLFNHLLEKDYVLYPINPRAVTRYRDRHRLSGAKSDTIDAKVLADILRTDRDNHRPILPDSELAKELKMISRDHSSLVAQRTRLLNQLIANLKEYYPTALTLFDDLGCPLALAFLGAYPDPVSAAKATVQELEELLHQQHSYQKGKAEKLHAILLLEKSKPGPVIVRTKSRYVLALISQLQPLVKAIKEYEKEISHLLSLHPDGSIFQELPGAGVVLAGRMLGEIGDCKERYPQKQALQALAGTAPVTRQSGKSLVVQFRFACQKNLRNTLQQFALTSIRCSAWAREYYDEQKRKGHSTSRALRALANRWLAIIWKLWHDGLHYDEAYHQSMRQQHAPTKALVV